MKLLVKISPNLTIQAEGETTKDIFKQISMIEETFEDTECGLCNSPNLQYVVRKVNDDEFYELRCKDCRAKLTFGHKKDYPGKIYPKRYKTDSKGKAVKEGERAVRLGQKGNGWVKWNPANESGRINFILKLLALMAKYDLCDMLFWRNEENASITFFINVNDVFFWGSADAEEVNEGNFHILEQSINDCIEIDPEGEIHGPELFVARIRQMRPQGATYPENQALWKLFDKCGPERPIDLGNPFKPGRV